MSINVYWSYIGKEWMRVKEPSPVRKSFYEKRLHEEGPLTEYHKCPFVHDYLENIYSLHSPYDYSFTLNNDLISSKNYDQDFFDEHIVVRSTQNKLFSFFMPFVFFTDQKSLQMNMKFPYIENNNITQRCSIFEGTIDIGKYFRNLDFTFFLKDPYNEFVIENGEVYEYIKFDTEEKINFKRFVPTEKIKEYLDIIAKTKENKKFSFEKPHFYYDNFLIKKLVMKEIKNNLCD